MMAPLPDNLLKTWTLVCKCMRVCACHGVCGMCNISWPFIPWLVGNKCSALVLDETGQTSLPQFLWCHKHPGGSDKNLISFLSELQDGPDRITSVATCVRSGSRDEDLKIYIKDQWPTQWHILMLESREIVVPDFVIIYFCMVTSLQCQKDAHWWTVLNIRNSWTLRTTFSLRFQFYALLAPLNLVEGLSVFMTSWRCYFRIVCDEVDCWCLS